MTPAPLQFSYGKRRPGLGDLDQMPLLPVTLALGGRIVEVVGLVDTGATVNVLPKEAGLRLGADWSRCPPVELAGNLTGCPARALRVSAVVEGLPEVPLVFAWADSDRIPVLLGQFNFLMQFDVCFFRSRSVFQVSPRQGPTEQGRD